MFIFLIRLSNHETHIWICKARQFVGFMTTVIYIFEILLYKYMGVSQQQLDFILVALCRQEFVQFKLFSPTIMIS